jgi:hypothetical protein
MNALNMFEVYAYVLFERVKKYFQNITFNLIDYARKLDGDLYIWPDGRHSVWAPEVEEDKVGCWHYDSLTQSLHLMASNGNVRKRWGWLSGNLVANGKEIEFSDHLTDLLWYAPPDSPHPSMYVVRTLFSQKLGLIISNKAIFTVCPRASAIDEKSFPAELITDEQLHEYDESWN